MKPALRFLGAICAVSCGHEGSAVVEDEPPATTACAEDPARAPDPFADCVDEHAPASPASLGADMLPQAVLGPPNGGGPTMGATTGVVSLGCEGVITIWFAEPRPIDGPGVDFAVFENPFHAGDIDFVEPARVLVSDDGERWYEFSCDADADDADGCAGVEPVLATPENGFATDPERAGGDWFDLAEVGLDTARFVRIVDATREHWGTDMWCMGDAAAFDLDALAIREGR